MMRTAKINLISYRFKQDRQTMTKELDIHYLAGLIKTKRKNRGLREVAQEIGGVSPSTLSRIENGKVPDMDTFLCICAWLQVSSEEFIKEKETDEQQQDTRSHVDRIEGYLRADLAPEIADALAKIVKAVYQAATHE